VCLRERGIGSFCVNVSDKEDLWIEVKKQKKKKKKKKKVLRDNLSLSSFKFHVRKFTLIQLLSRYLSNSFAHLHEAILP